MPTLLLKFDAPIQSWGTTLKLKDHDTQMYPSKSGVIGMIASAMGRRRDENINDIADLRFGVRIESPGILLDDFQVSEVSEKEKKIGHRKYLSDAVFLCGIEGEKERLTEIQYALLHPANAIYLGRRSCPATPDLVQGLYDEDLESVLGRYDRSKGLEQIVIETDSMSGIAVKDVPISFSPFNRQYSYRFIKII